MTPPKATVAGVKKKAPAKSRKTEPILTMRERKRLSEAAEKAKEEALKTGSTVKAAPPPAKATKTAAKRSASIFSMVMNTAKSEPRKKAVAAPRPSVLMRRTRRADLFRKQTPKVATSAIQSTEAGKSDAKGSEGMPEQDGKKEGEEDGDGEPTGLLDLPEELRRMIWKEAVVDDRCFVFSDSPFGEEQPDLAMTSRQIRSEALQVYYSENTFAVDVAPTKKSKSDFKPILRWIEILETGGWLKYVRKWAFPYSPPGCWTTRSNADEQDSSFVVSLIFTLQQAPQEQEPEQTNVAGNAKTKEAGKSAVRRAAPTIEVHREASCVMTGLGENSACSVMPSPEWLDKIIADASDGEGRVETKEVVLNVAKALASKAQELVPFRCAAEGQSEAEEKREA